jgi:putative colanic acid biosynthesis UDP-glucose lipid carrier transferase
MTHREKHTQHQRLFFYMVGIGAAAVALFGYFAAAAFERYPFADLDLMKAAIIAATTCVLFYQFDQLLSTRQMSYMLGRASLRWVQVVMVVLLAYVLLPESDRDHMREVMQLWAIGTWPLILGALALMRLSAVRLYSGTDARRAIFIQPGRQSRTLALRLARSPMLGIRIDGYFGRPYKGEDSTVKRLGGLDDLDNYLRTTPCQVVFLGTGLITDPQATPIMDRLGDTTAAIYFVPESPRESPFQINVADIAGVPLLALHETEILGMSRVLKRAFDVVVALGMLLVFGLPMILIAIGIKRTSPGPVFFRQTRYGQDGKPISIYKFRSMHVHLPEAAKVQQATRGDPRITPLGRFIRKTSLDELPQILNVLDGSMSLVGPRPHAAEHNELYRQQIKGYMLRHTVKPGITGWAQVNGLRGETDTLDKMMQRVEHDRYYIQNWSLWLDIKIIARTALLIVRDRSAF